MRGAASLHFPAPGCGARRGGQGLIERKTAVGIGADVTVMDIKPARLAYFDDIFGARVTTLYSTPSNIDDALSGADLVIGAVLIPGAVAPHLMRRAQLARMQAGAVIVDVAVDQGGCVETTRPTTHDDPVFTEAGILHYCVANMPGAVPITATQALTGTTLEYGLALATRGFAAACRRIPALARGVNTHAGHCVHAQVAASLELPCQPLECLLA